eukprot:4696296-Amphidinium_carterae.1
MTKRAARDAFKYAHPEVPPCGSCHNTIVGPSNTIHEMPSEGFLSGQILGAFGRDNDQGFQARRQILN